MKDPLHIDVRRSVLGNGLLVLFAPMPQARTAAFSLAVAVGSRHDPPGRQGLAHFLEHMLFRGTARHPGPRQLNAAIEALGAPMGASTGRDHTLFEMRTFPESLGEALALLGEMVTQPRLADLAVEREVILQERLDEVDENGRSTDADNLALKALFPGSGLAWSILGTRRSLMAIGDGDLREHLGHHYTGRNLVLAVAGPMDAEAVHDAAERALGGLPAGRRSPTSRAKPRADLPAVAATRDEGSQADFDLTIVTAPAVHADAPTLDLIVRLLDDGEASRVRARLCDDLGLTYEVGAHAESYRDIGLLRVTGAVEPARLPELVREAAGLLSDLRSRPVPPDELERVRRRVLLDLLTALESPESVAAWLANVAIHRPDEEASAVLARLLALEPGHVQAVARRYLRASRAQLTVVGDVGRVRRHLDAALAELGP